MSAQDNSRLTERRRAARREPLGNEALSRVRLRTGRELSVVDVSNGGALVEGSVRLLPGTHVDVHVITPQGRVLVRSRVTRCFVAALRADAVSYRGALAFDRPVDTAAPTVNGGEARDDPCPLLAATTDGTM